MTPNVTEGDDEAIMNFKIPVEDFESIQKEMKDEEDAIKTLDKYIKDYPEETKTRGGITRRLAAITKAEANDFVNRYKELIYSAPNKEIWELMISEFPTVFEAMRVYKCLKEYPL